MKASLLSRDGLFWGERKVKSFLSPSAHCLPEWALSFPGSLHCPSSTFIHKLFNFAPFLLHRGRRSMTTFSYFQLPCQLKQQKTLQLVKRLNLKRSCFKISEIAEEAMSTSSWEAGKLYGNKQHLEIPLTKQIGLYTKTYFKARCSKPRKCLAVLCPLCITA